MSELPILAQRLKELRHKSGMTQTEVALKVNITQSAYAFYETGKKEPRLETIKLLADVFHTSIDYLVGRY